MDRRTTSIVITAGLYGFSLARWAYLVQKQREALEKLNALLVTGQGIHILLEEQDEAWEERLRRALQKAEGRHKAEMDQMVQDIEARLGARLDEIEKARPIAQARPRTKPKGGTDEVQP
jgi:hypothetical protein